MRAKAPLDVDLEDKLLYGLTPMRLGYVVVAMLMGMTLWDGGWAPTPVRAIACLAMTGLGAAAAWGRWRGRASDEWLTDVVTFVVRTCRVVVDREVLERELSRLVKDQTDR